MDITAAVRTETKTIYEQMVEALCRPGTPKKTMDAMVSRALDGYPLWRIRACRLGEGGHFSAAAVFDLQQRFLRWREAHQRRQATDAALRERRRADIDQATLEQIRARHLEELQRIDARLAVLRALRGDDPG